MHLTDLTENYEGSFDPEILGLTLDSRQVKEGWLFAALPGSLHDGRDFVKNAIDNGAVAVLVSTEDSLSPPGREGFFRENCHCHR